MEDPLASEKHVGVREQQRSRRPPARGGRSWALMVSINLTLVGCKGDPELPEPPAPIRRLRIDGTEPIGKPCTAPPKGQSDIEGYAFGATFAPQKETNFHVSDNLFVVYAASELALDATCELQTREMFMRFIVQKKDARMETPLDVPADVFLALENFKTDPNDPIRSGQVIATFGTVTFDGYDPSTSSLCGSIDVVFNDDEGGHLTGSFQAPIQCPDPAQTKNQ